MGLWFLSRSQPRPRVRSETECGANVGKRRSPSTVAATQSQQSGVRGPCRHGFSLANMLLPRRLRNNAPPGGSFLSVLGTRQPAVCGRQSASVCGMFLAPQRNRRYRLKREDLHGNLCATGDDVDGYCGECGQVLGDVILVTVQGSEKS